MKITPAFAAGALSLGLALSAQAQIKFTVPTDTDQSSPPSPPAAAAAPAAPAGDLTEVQIAEDFGWLIGRHSGVLQYEFTAAQLEALTRGFSEAVNGQPPPYASPKAQEQMSAYIEGKQKAFLDKLRQHEVAESDAFFNRLKDDKNAIGLPSGLYYQVLQPGDGPYPKPTDLIKINYTGRLIDGTVFDSTVNRQPVVLGLDKVIPGWTEGMQKINKGGKIRLYVPAKLAYGDQGYRSIPPGATLIFDVELLDINPAADGTGK